MVYTIGGRAGNIRGTLGKVGIDGLIETKNSPQILARDLFNFGADIRSYKAPLEASIKNVLIPHIREMFKTEGGAGGLGGWEPLSDFTKAMRRSEGYAEGPILHASGTLERSATALARWNIKGRGTMTAGRNVVDAGRAEYDLSGVQVSRKRVNKGRELFFGAGAAMGSIFADASGKTSGGIPARPWIFMDTKMEIAIQMEFEKWILARRNRLIMRRGAAFPMSHGFMR